MNKRDIDFVKTIVCCLEANPNFLPPYEFTQRGIRNNLRNFYGYSTEKSVHDKFKQFLQEGIIVQHQFCFQLTDKAIALAKE